MTQRNMVTAKTVNITGGTFTQKNTISNPLDKLKPVSSAGIYALDQEGCMKGTRISLLNELHQWSMDATAPWIFWLDGMAGTGKSAIARSFCHFLDENQLLGGSFFCLRGNESREDVKHILPTLAWFLARQDLRYQNALLPILQDAPDVVDYSIERQFEFLFEKPLHRMSINQPPLVLVIDALDECSDAELVTNLLKKLLSVFTKFPIKFFLTSRPERHILTQFKSGLYRILRLHDIEQNLVQEDIFLYLSNRLKNIRDSSTDPSMFPDEWPVYKDIQSLTQLAGKLFIYAFTAVKYIEDRNHVNRLQILVGLTVDAGQPFYRPLDDMYSLVLDLSLNPRDCTNEEINMTKQILGAIIAIREPLYLSGLAKLLRVSPHDIRANIDRIHAVVKVPPFNKDGVISTFHASFVDFLTIPERAPENMRISLPTAHRDLAYGCLDLLNSSLHFNIAGVKTSYLPNSEQELATIPAPLKYASVHWAHHIDAVDNATALLPHLEKFLFEKFLFWLEVLSVSGMANLASGIISLILTRRNMTRSLVTFLHDANHFVGAFEDVIEMSVAHIYLSALPSVRKTSKIAEVFMPMYPSTIKVTTQGIRHERRPLLDLRGHDNTIQSISVSQDGTRIVSGSGDKTIRIWDARTGQEVMKPLKGHTDSVESVCFSPDGTRIVSGSEDATIRIWDARTGEEVLKPLDRHTAGIWSVAYSPDGTRIASGSCDNTIRIWHARTGKEVVNPLEGHTRSVCTVAFSPDGTRIASGSWDRTIRIWDAKTGKEVIRPLSRHTSLVRSVQFSPDGTHIVSGSSDETIRIWDARTGEEVIKPLMGHTDMVFTVCFSPDGAHIVSGSYDMTIRIWDVRTGKEIINPLNAHTRAVWSADFSPDGIRLVSGSGDKTIQIWDVKNAGEEPLDPPKPVKVNRFLRLLSGISNRTMRIWDGKRDETVKKPLNGPTSPVRCVGFSPDGTRVVSGSNDNKIQIWDARTGREIMKPLNGHTGCVRSVGFSPDGTRIVSGSDDGSIRVWNVRTGKEVIKPLEGHGVYVGTVDYSPDGTRIVSGSRDMTIRIWDATTGREIVKPLTGHTNFVFSVRFSWDGTRIVSGSADRTIRIWDARTGKEIMKPLIGHTNYVYSVAFSPDGTRIVSGSYDLTIRIWDTRTGKEVIKPFTGHTLAVNCVCFSQDGTRIVSGSTDDTIRLWDVETGEVIKLFIGHTDSVNSVAFSQDGTRIVSGSSDRTIRVWDVRVGEVMKPMDGHDQSVSSNPTFIQPELCLVSLSESNGWIRGPRGELIFWALPAWRSVVVWPPFSLVIGWQSRVLFDLSQFVQGTAWTECAYVS